LEKRTIGSLAVPVVGLGCNNFGWRIGAEETRAVVEAALASGVNFFDTADVYGEGRSEEFLGRALGGRRSETVLATKFGLKWGSEPGGGRAAYVRRACEGSLRRLATDRIDLYQLHRPDPETPMAETLGALEELVREGKVREIGCSNFSAAQIREADEARGGRARFVSVQNEYSLLKREAETDVVGECARRGLAFLPYFPLANGLLTGKYRPGEAPPQGSRAADGFGPKVFSEENLELAAGLAEFAASRGHTLIELAFSWLASRPAVASVIAGAKTAEQVRMNARAADWRLSREELAAIEEIARGRRLGSGGSA
jgi:aryl-alcohol dehydrogenase-like predicted oxidoreductase